MNILIRELSRKTTEDEVYALFAQFGTVQSCNLVTDTKTGRSKGFGFADMPNEAEAKAAIKGLNGRLVHGAKVRVKKARRPSQSL